LTYNSYLCGMKIFSFLLSIYIFCLAIMPCSDIHLVLHEIEHSSAYHNDYESQDNRDHSEDSDNHCSPFCTCSCCHTSINFEFGSKNVLVSTKFVLVSRVDNTFLYYDSPSSTYRNTIWQPPKVNA
jgi:hypothetical protein